VNQLYDNIGTPHSAFDFTFFVPSADTGPVQWS